MKLWVLALPFLLAGCRMHPAPHVTLLETLERSGPTEGVREFKVEPRTAEMKQFPCARCHDRPLAAMKRPSPSAHWDVRLEHSASVVTACNTCHGGEKMQSLRLLSGAEVGFDDGHQLCAKCHSRQAADWRGGVHGKRTSGWAGERRVLSCAGCHNPHSPRLRPRWPAVSRPHSQETP